MASKPEISKSVDGHGDGEKHEQIARAMGLALNNATVYGIEHKVTGRSIQQAFGKIRQLLDDESEVSIIMLETALVINGSQMGLKNNLTKALHGALQAWGINSFAIQPEMTHDQYARLLEILSLNPQSEMNTGGFADVLAAAGVKSVQVTHATYKQVADDEEVRERQAAESRKSPTEQDMREAQAFIAGGEDGEMARETAVKAVQSLTDDARHLSELILKAAEKLREQFGDQGETLARKVLHCMQRAADALMSSPDLATQKGKKSLAKTLEKVEEELTESLKQSPEGLNSRDEYDLHCKFEDLADELQIEVLASSYMKKKRAIEASESRILRFIRNKGLERVEETDLREKLVESGLDADGWKDLLMRSGTLTAEPLPGDEREDSIAAVTRLNKLVTNLAEFLEIGQGVADEKTLHGLTGLLDRLRLEVGNLVDRTRRKIQQLVEQLVTEAELQAAIQRGEILGPPKEDRLSRRRLLEIIAEIAQELCQPLTVINCAVQMLSAGKLGEVNQAQLEMLNAALHSGERLEKLIRKLTDIADVPMSLMPDQQTLAELYRQ